MVSGQTRALGQVPRTTPSWSGRQRAESLFLLHVWFPLSLAQFSFLICELGTPTSARGGALAVWQGGHWAMGVAAGSWSSSHSRVWRRQKGILLPPPPGKLLTVAKPRCHADGKTALASGLIFFKWQFGFVLGLQGLANAAWFASSCGVEAALDRERATGGALGPGARLPDPGRPRTGAAGARA